MHYTPMEWTANGRLSVSTKDPLLQGVLGLWKGTAARGLSHRDKLLLNKVYGCIDSWLSKCGLTTEPCEGEGYTGQHCRCVCPPGTEGSRCQHHTAGYYDDLLSPCSQRVNYDTIIKSPNYPYNYDKETWCVWVLHSDQCRAPVITILDFEMGPRDPRHHCTYDYLEIRTNSSDSAQVVCGREVSSGSVYRSKGDTMVLFFNGELGNLRGFEARLKFEDIPGCCRKMNNGSHTHWLSPGYPQNPSQPFVCSIQLDNTKPASVHAMLSSPLQQHTLKRKAEPCPLLLCLPDNRCSRFCGGSSPDHVIARLPTAGTSHTLMGNTAMQLTLVTTPSPCHKILSLGGSHNSSGFIHMAVRRKPVTPITCEWRIKSTIDSHIQVRFSHVKLIGRRSFLVVDESGRGRYWRNSSRVYRAGDAVPALVVSSNDSVTIVWQAELGSALNVTYATYLCSDIDTDCPYWTVDGECDNNDKWMRQNCRMSCGRCDVPLRCEDRHPDCQFWAKHGQCGDNARWMLVNCARSCGHCAPCADHTPLCAAWRALGDCDTNPGYMTHHCAVTCGTCVHNGKNAHNSTNSSKLQKLTNDTISLPNVVNSTMSTIPEVIKVSRIPSIIPIIVNSTTRTTSDVNKVSIMPTRIPILTNSTMNTLPDVKKVSTVPSHRRRQPKRTEIEENSVESAVHFNDVTFGIVNREEIEEANKLSQKPNKNRSKHQYMINLSRHENSRRINSILNEKHNKKLSNIRQPLNRWQNNRLSYNLTKCQPGPNCTIKLGITKKQPRIQYEIYAPGQRNRTVLSSENRDRFPNSTSVIKSENISSRMGNGYSQNVPSNLIQQTNLQQKFTNATSTVTENTINNRISFNGISEDLRRPIHRHTALPDSNTNLTYNRNYSLPRQATKPANGRFSSREDQDAKLANGTNSSGRDLDAANGRNASGRDQSAKPANGRNSSSRDLDTKRANDGNSSRRRGFNNQHRHVQKVLHYYNDLTEVLDAFLSLPLCSELRKIGKVQRFTPLMRHATLSNITFKMRRSRSRRKKMKIYRLLKQIFRPHSTNVQFNRMTITNNKRFNRKFKRILSKIYRRRKHKLSQYIVSNNTTTSNPTVIRVRWRGRKRKLLQYMKRYRLNTLFKLFKIKVLPFRSTLTSVRKKQKYKEKFTVLCLVSKVYIPNNNYNMFI